MPDLTGKDRAKIAAAVSAAGVFLLMVVLLKFRNWMPFVAAFATYAGVLLATWPVRRREKPVELPDGVDRNDYQLAMDTMRRSAAKLRDVAAAGQVVDRPLFNHMAELVDAIRAHHVANPLHVQRTRTFIRNTLPRIVGAVEGYLELSQRAGSDHGERISDISRQLQDFVPVLERIDRACIDNDVMALEIHVEVLNDQLDRDR